MAQLGGLRVRVRVLRRRDAHSRPYSPKVWRPPAAGVGGRATVLLHLFAPRWARCVGVRTRGGGPWPRSAHAALSLRAAGGASLMCTRACSQTAVGTAHARRPTAFPLKRAEPA
uniref:Uncharacterized protein n=1 Tax=Heliothis virescens TaxID=7102 RepID=A0A2A4K6C1_HELVI